MAVTVFIGESSAVFPMRLRKALDARACRK